MLCSLELSRNGGGYDLVQSLTASYYQLSRRRLMKREIACGGIVASVVKKPGVWRDIDAVT